MSFGLLKTCTHKKLRYMFVKALRTAIEVNDVGIAEALLKHAAKNFMSMFITQEEISILIASHNFKMINTIITNHVMIRMPKESTNPTDAPVLQRALSLRREEDLYNANIEH